LLQIQTKNVNKTWFLNADLAKSYKHLRPFIEIFLINQGSFSNLHYLQ